MNKLYLLGGPSRAGKSTIMEGLVRQHPMHLVATDVVQQGIRSLFVDDPFQILNTVQYSGKTTFKRRDTKEIVEKEFANEGTEIDLAHSVIIGMIDHFRRNRLDVAMEGVHITPDWVSSLDVDGYEIHPAFVGFTSADHTDNIVAYARKHEHDWINDWLERHNDDVEQLREWMSKQAEENKQTKKRAEELGYKYFDIESMPFDDYVEAVQKHLLGK